MSVSQVVVRCPVCQHVGPARALAVDSRGAEITCDKCGVATRFPPYSLADSEGPEPGLAAPPWSDAGSELPAASSEGLAAETPEPSAEPEPGPETPAVESETPAVESEALPEEVLEPVERAEAEPVEEIGSDDPRMLLVYEVEGLSEELIELYRQSVRQGDDVDAHAQVVSSAVATGDLHQMGSLYRRRGERIPGDAVAEAMRKRVMGLALATLTPTDAETAQKKIRGAGMFGAVLMLLVGIAMLVYVAITFR